MPQAKEIDSPFGQLLRLLRTSALLSQEQLAQQSHLSVRTIRDLERGRVLFPHGESVRLLAEALGLEGETRMTFERQSRRHMCFTSPGQVIGRRRPEAFDIATRSLGTYAGVSLDPADQRENAVPAKVAIAELPMDTPVFVAREAELACLDAILFGHADWPVTATIVAVGGCPGVGKSALALRWAHRVVSEFPDGQLYVDLCGFNPTQPPVRATDALVGFLGALGVPAARIPDSRDARATLYRRLLADRRVLVILDDASDADQVRSLLPGVPGCVVLVTSRNRLTKLVATECAYPMTLDPLTDQESRTLLVRRVGASRAAAEPSAVDDIISWGSGLPIAISMFAARAVMHPAFPLGALVAELRERTGGRYLLGHGEITAELRARFAGSYRALGFNAAELVRLFGHVAAPELTPHAAAELAGVSVSEAEFALVELANAHLVTEHSPHRFGMNKLLGTYAAELGCANEAAPDECRA
ncbi:NB-ARC domain-containing protein [Nocardia sp. NPDC046473]|uniref:NB-ARC domain-containing protein n=1 Tax=Nocardia sp. NPDC046473 TaxID=3155733 RepID=UPI0033F04995